VVGPPWASHSRIGLYTVSRAPQQLLCGGTLSRARMSDGPATSTEPEPEDGADGGTAAAAAAVGPAGGAPLSRDHDGSAKEGWLTKQGSFRKTWKPKWFVLEWPELRYYKQPPAGPGDKPSGVIRCDEVALSDSLSMARTGREHCFGIFHKSKDAVFLQAESAAVMIGWVNAIRNQESVGMIDFDQLRTLGEGSFGQVWLVKHRTTGQMLAMKVLDKQRTKDEEAVEATRVERDILLRVRHPYVVQMQYAFQTADSLFMVMDYHNGGDLYSHMLRVKRFGEGAVRLWVAEIALALGYLHETGVVFRDLKPENVLLDGRGHAHITDFGLSKLVDHTHVPGAPLRLTSFCGSPYYLAP
jgi:tRNA A-37 threonylcarbamoyl transferase component Bud32